MENLINKLKEKKIIISIILGIILLLGILLFNMKDTSATEAFNCAKEEEQESVSVTYEIKVDIKGAVNNPGVYKFKLGSIVKDAIEAAGGLKEDADTSNLNLSKLLTNQMVIKVYTKEEVEKEKEEPIKEEDNLININTATVEELTKITGVGESKANLIINYRETCGEFKSIEEIKNIKGFGDALFTKIKPYITV